MAGGRPRIYSDEELVNAATDLISRSNADASVFPSINKLSIELDINRDTVYERAKTSKELSDALKKIEVVQQQRLLENGLLEVWNSGFAKFLLSANHGMREKSETDITSKGERIIPILGGITNDISANNSNQEATKASE